MPVTIFYSWQSDTPPRLNRSFIEGALKRAVELLEQQVEIQEALRDESIVLDRDTQGIPGTPPIADTIFAKIATCSVFVADFTFVCSSPSGRKIPNPNVLIEYGWAVKDLGYSRMLPVMNTAFGHPRGNMPFDMQHLRNPITYELLDAATKEDIDRARQRLSAELAEAIKLILTVHGPREDRNPAPAFEPTSPTWSQSVFWEMNKRFGVLDRGNLTLHVDEGERLFLRVIPTRPVAPVPSNADAMKLVTSIGRLFSMSNSHRDAAIGRNQHGVFVCEYVPHMFDKEEAIVTNLSQLFMSREIWGIDTQCINSKRLKGLAKVNFAYFPCAAFERVFVNTLSNYMDFAFRALGLSAPLKFIAGATNVTGFRMSLPVSMGLGPEFSGQLVQDHVVYEGTIGDSADTPTKLLRPFFDKVWDECGLSRPSVDCLE